MKKRKELDALVANGGPGRAKAVAAAGKTRARNSTRQSTLKSVISSEQPKAARAHELLGNDSDSSELLDDYTILHPHQRTKKGGGMMRGMCCAASCLPLCLVVLVTTCMVALGTLLWLHLGLREDMDLMRAHLQKVEAQSKETPEALHDYHIQLKGLESNVTAFGQDIKKINTEINSLNDAVKQLKEVSTGLRESIAAAPEMKTLPKDVVSITESVAALGSKISMLESNVEDLKKVQRQLTDSERELKGEHQQIKNSLNGLSVQKETTTRDETQALSNRLTDYIHQELVQVASAVDELNVSVSARLRDVDQHFQDANETLGWVANDLSQLHVYVYQNLSAVMAGTKGTSSVDPGELSSALKQEAQHLLTELLSNHSSVSGLESLSDGTEWKEVLTHAHQVALAYWALLKDLSLVAGNVQEPSAISETLLTRVVSQLTANTTAAIKILNESLTALSIRTEKLELQEQESHDIAAPPATSPVVHSSAAQTTTLPQQQQEPRAVPSGAESPNESPKSPAEASTTISSPGFTPTPPTAVPAILRKLRSKMSVSQDQPRSSRIEGTATEIEAIL